MTRQKIAIGLVVGALFAGVVMAHAADYASGVKAYQRGDYATALRVFRQLADQGHASAQHNLGVMYDKSQGVPQDNAEGSEVVPKGRRPGPRRCPEQPR